MSAVPFKGRKRFLVGYDISESKRLRTVHKTMKGYGWAMQYSVFICDLSEVELIDLKTKLSDIIHHSADTVAFVDLGEPSTRGAECFSFLGARTDLPTSGPLII